jgi:hypothetical protein
MHVLCILRITRQIVGTSKKIAWLSSPPLVAGQHFGALHRTRRLHGSWRQVDGGVQVTAVERGMDPIGRASRAASTRSPRGRAGVGQHEGALCRDVRIVEDARRAAGEQPRQRFLTRAARRSSPPCSSRSNFPVISAAAERIAPPALRNASITPGCRKLGDVIYPPGGARIGAQSGLIMRILNQLCGRARASRDLF